MERRVVIILVILVLAAAGAEPVGADMRGEVVCGVPADEAVLITRQLDNGSWRVWTPVAGSAIPTYPTERAALTGLAGRNPSFVCEVTIRVNFREFTARFYRLRLEMMSGAIAGESEDPRILIVGVLERGREAEHDDDANDVIDTAEARQARGESGSAASVGSGRGSTGIRVGETVVFDGMEFVGIPPGEFLMGSSGQHAADDEQPVTQVRITKGFYLGKYEVTQAEWQAVMGRNPSGFYKDCGGNCPVVAVSWEYVQVFIGRLNGMSGGKRYRLPTEAEWEYAARAGTTMDRYAENVSGIAWYRQNSGGLPHPVGHKAPNGWGLHDMLGNVSEWVEDWQGDYPGGAVTDPAGPGSGSERVYRGGGWFSLAGDCRSPYRGGSSPSGGGGDLGFRLLREE